MLQKENINRRGKFYRIIVFGILEIIVGITFGRLSLELLHDIGFIE